MTIGSDRVNDKNISYENDGQGGNNNDDDNDQVLLLSDNVR